MGSIVPVENELSSNGLTVLIAGAGIGGLATAVALRQQGHTVKLFERSRFANELGAAINLTPNANGLLKRIGIDAKEYGAVLTEHFRNFSADGHLESEFDIPQESWQHEWLLIHRAHLHDALKEKAQLPGEGPSIVLHTANKVVDINPDDATITLDNGTMVQGDLVIGADGIHSMARFHVQNGDTEMFSSGMNAFRFLVSRQDVLDDPEIADLFCAPGMMDVWINNESRIIVYPCVHNTVLNFVCVHPATLTSGITDGWQQSVGKNTLLAIYHKYGFKIRRALEKADPETLKIWPLLDMDTLPSWVNNSLALIGDAAHPFLPYRASGGAMAIEDGFSLAAMLPGDVKKEEVPQRLKLYERARHERVTTIQEITRDSGKKPSTMAKMAEDISYIFDHDEWDHSKQLLREHLWKQNGSAYYRQPTVFGPMPGPRQDFDGKSRTNASTRATFHTASIKIKTSRTLLKTLLPSPLYKFSGTGSVAYATFSLTTLDGLDWLAGGGYNHFGLYIHGVEYKQSNGEIKKGDYLPVLFEDFTDPIISDREELGFPKIFSSIDVNRHVGSYHASLSWRGAVWGMMEMTGLDEVDNLGQDSETAHCDGGLLVHRYTPRVGADQKEIPEAEYPVFVDSAYEREKAPSRINRAWKAEQANMHINPLDWTRLPTLHHIISRLAEIPTYGIEEARVVEGEGVPDLSSATGLS